MPPRRRPRTRAHHVDSQGQGSRYAEDNPQDHLEEGDSINFEEGNPEYYEEEDLDEDEREFGEENPEDDEEESEKEEDESESPIRENPWGDPMDQFMNLLRQNLNPRRPGRMIASAFRAFKSLKPPEFRGTTDPVEARVWLKEMEKSFKILGISEGQKTVFAAYLLKGKANF